MCTAQDVSVRGLKRQAHSVREALRTGRSTLGLRARKAKGPSDLLLRKRLVNKCRMAAVQAAFASCVRMLASTSLVSFAVWVVFVWASY